MSDTLQRSSKLPSEFALNPHLSLIYQSLNQEIKKSIITSIRLPKSEVVFDQVRAISTPEKVQKREDVEKWRVVSTSKLE